MKKGFFKIYIYISIIFLVVALYLADYLVVPKILNYNHLVISIGLLFLGFIFDGVAWTRILHKQQFKVSYAQGIASAGLSIFGKYIPGKLWVILGRAEYISEKYKYPRKELGFASLDAQFISIWIGLILGALGLLFLDGLQVYGYAILLMFIGLTLVIFTNIFHGLFKKVIKLVLKKELDIPRLSFIKLVRVIPYFLVNWLFWCISFYFLISSVAAQEVSIVAGFGFALAGSMGILAVIAPGGIGVREGILTFYLSLVGFDVELAATVSVVSRLWFLLGEVFIFALGITLRSNGRNAETRQSDL